jgi:hypothetical protein
MSMFSKVSQTLYEFIKLKVISNVRNHYSRLMKRKFKMSETVSGNDKL